MRTANQFLVPALLISTQCTPNQQGEGFTTGAASTTVDPTTSTDPSKDSTETTESAADSSSSTSTTDTSTEESTVTDVSTFTDNTTTTTDPPCTEDCCGNGTIEASETCDDGNDKSDDGCDECQVVSCGNGFVDIDLDETCDSGKDAMGNDVECGTNGLACTYCGDGLRNGFEQCDMGSENKTLDIPLQENVYEFPQSPCNPTCTRNFRYVFVTAERTHGNLGGVSGADAFCQTQANLDTSEVTGRVFRAWLSSSDNIDTNNINEELSPKTNMWIESDIPYLLTDSKSIVAPNFLSISAQILRPINITQGGVPPALECGENEDAPCRVWTATKADGTKNDHEDSADCTRWTSNTDGDFGSVGHYENPQEWTSPVSSNSNCKSKRHLYCFEQ